MDETDTELPWIFIMLTGLGFNIGKRGRNAYVICSGAEKKVYQAEPGRTEWVTVLECICGDGSKISPLVIFKGESIQTSWIPSESEMNGDWSWSSNTKGWTCDAIGEDWIRTVFKLGIHTKAGGATRLLVVDGHGSHVTVPFIRFCIDHEILVLLLPLHSSHLTQPLDVGIFSPLKRRMSEELDKILRYGFSNIKKFEWANCYCIARPDPMKPCNVKSAWSGAGLIPFNPRKVIRRIQAAFAEQETLLINDTNSAVDTPISDFHAEKFSLVSHTPSKVNSIALRSASEALAHNVQAGIFDTPTREYILKESSLVNQYETLHTVREKHLNGMNGINKKRRVMASGKRVLLKDQTIITTEGIYEQVKACEEATNKKRRVKGHSKRKSGLQVALNTANDTQTKEEARDVVILDEIVVGKYNRII